MTSLLKQSPGVINVGLAQFAETVADAGGTATQLEWAPPALGDRKAGMALARLTNHPVIEKANAVAFSAFLATSPRLRGIGTAALKLLVDRLRSDGDVPLVGLSPEPHNAAAIRCYEKTGFVSRRDYEVGDPKRVYRLMTLEVS